MNIIYPSSTYDNTFSGNKFKEMSEWKLYTAKTIAT